MSNLFTWNDLVRVKSNAPLSYFPNQIAVVCGMLQVQSEKLRLKFGVSIGDWIYTIEFGDGSSVEIPESYLEKYPNSSNQQKDGMSR